MYCINCSKRINYSKINTNDVCNKYLFCCGECRNVYIKMLRETARYKKLRQIIFERDKYICQICKNQADYPHLHHIVEMYKDISKTFLKSNCLTVCEDCHHDIHKELIKKILKYKRDKK